MATPYGYSGPSLSAEPSRTLLQKLLEEINGTPIPTVLRNRSTPAASQHSHPRQAVWVGGAPIAQDARRKLRAADEARMRQGASNATDGAAGNGKPIVRVDSSSLHRHSLSVIEEMRDAHNESPPDPVSRPHDYLRFMSVSEDVPQAQPAGGLRLETSFLDQPTASPGTRTTRPLSPLIFSNVDFETGSSRSGNSISPTEAPTSATTITGEQPKTPSDAGSIQSSKRTFSLPFESEALPKRVRHSTLPELYRHSYPRPRTGSRSSHRSVSGSVRFQTDDPTLTERVATPRGSIDTRLPEVSSFRPGDVTPQGHYVARAGIRVPPPSRNPSASPELPDTPPWMRPMHLVDTDNMSIYKNVHSEDPRHQLCLHCFSQHGDFCKVLAHGYESCGRHEVLKSHYWESGAWPEDEDDE